MSKNTDLERRVKACLEARFSAAPMAMAYYVDLWVEHRDAGLAGPHFVTELTSKSEETFRQRLWEMVLGRHLRGCGHRISTQAEGEPDYRFNIGNLTVWVEAISPTPGSSATLDHVRSI